MPRQRVDFINGEIYHICYRAVGDSVVFHDIQDYYRGIFSIYEFNNFTPVSIFRRRQQRPKEKSVRSPTSYSLPDVRDPYVEVIAFCFMPNHIHLLLKQLKENGISQFIQKVGGGYANYFNQKYGRKGHLFNQFKAVYIQNDDQLKNVLTYIHANPISLIEPGWKDNGIKDQKKVMRFLEKEYRWSSFFDYLGKKNFPSVTVRGFALEIVGGEEGSRESVWNWIRYKGEIGGFNYLVLE